MGTAFERLWEAFGKLKVCRGEKIENSEAMIFFSFGTERNLLISSVQNFLILLRLQNEVFYLHNKESQSLRPA